MKKKSYLVVLWALASTSAADAMAAEAQAAGEAKAPQAKSQHWSYQPVKSVEAPTVKNQKWVRTPIDALVLEQLEEKGIDPSYDADRATFIRRATLDVWGVIPTPEEVNAFVNDTSDNAHEKLVDRLLASPKYGE
ncbi:DUF1549 domain-containing protein, partial [Methylobacter sp.]|uniref:DUF1549 domain-containing protein n=1 Tax=Methylobacter sp. TaxID=2051955 RepID=UPI003DA319E4